MPRRLRPGSFGEAASALVDAARGGEAVRILGGATKTAWGSPIVHPDVELHTAGLDRIVEHNAGDLTAVLEAGVPFSRAQQTFAAAGQMLALDPWLGADERATVGGVMATGDCGPLSHRYGAPRDLVLGMTVALSDGTIARSGGKVIKNVAGYDVAKLFCGAFGTLGLILSVNVRLHPLPDARATAIGVSEDPGVLARAGRTLGALPLELEALDVAWRGARGGLLAQCGGIAAERRAARVAEAMRSAGLSQIEVVSDDAELWSRQRAGQRSAAHALLRIAALPSQLEGVIAAVRAVGGTLVGRVVHGRSYAELDPDAVGGVRECLPAGAIAVLLDAPADRSASLDAWGAPRDETAHELMRRVKRRFDPAAACNPGLFVGAI